MLRYIALIAFVLCSDELAYGGTCPTRDAFGNPCISSVSNEAQPMYDGKYTNYVLKFKKNPACRGNYSVSAKTNEGNEKSNGFADNESSLNCTSSTEKCTGFRKEFTFWCADDSTDLNQSQDRSLPRKIAKDACSNDSCSDNARDTDAGRSFEFQDATAKFCDQQYRKCLMDGQEQPNFSQSERQAKLLIPEERWNRAMETAAEQFQPNSSLPQSRQPTVQGYRGDTFGELADCFFDPIYKSRGGVPICLATNRFGGGPPCETMDIVNGTQAYICQGGGGGDGGGPNFYYRRKAEYGGGRSW